MPESEEYDRTWVEQRPPAPSPVVDDVLSNALPDGTQISEFEVNGLIGIGGFGIVYLAQDRSLGRSVALKEYMPSSLAARVEGLTVTVKSARLAETFAIGLRSFVNEARLLAQFDHPSLVKVYRFWEANGTAYMVMPFYEGTTLKQVLQKMPTPPDEAWLRRLLEPLLEALEVIHRERCFHRDIAPDNILLLQDGRPLLLDFGAARRVITDRTQALTVILKPGYAPLEQYAEVPHMKQGAWTDIYALAAVVYNAITGRPPPPSVGRSIKDTLAPLSTAAAGRYSPGFLRAIDRALAVKPEDRPQTIAEFRELLAQKDVPKAVDGASTPKPVPAQSVRGESPPQAPHGSRSAAGKVPLLVGAAGAMLLVAGGVLYVLQGKSGAPETPGSRSAPQVTTTAPAAGHAQPLPAPEPAGSSPPAREAQPAGGVQTVDRKSLSEQQLVDLLLGEDGSTNGRKSAAKPFDPVDMLQAIYDQREPEHAVTVLPDKTRVRIGQDKLRFRVSSTQAGYLYILMVGTDRNHFNVIFPNAIDAENGIGGGGELALPRPGWAMTASGPPGTNRFVAIVSENRRDFSAAGLVKAGSFAEFPRATAERIARQTASGAANPFAGKAVCPAGRSCSARYGAAMFTIDEIE